MIPDCVMIDHKSIMHIGKSVAISQFYWAKAENVDAAVQTDGHVGHVTANGLR
jgi:hypothetical protein